MSQVIAAAVLMSTLNPELPADFTYVWPWGETGACTATEVAQVEQQAVNLDRAGQVRFTPIAKEAPPLTRDERIALRATNMTLEEDLAAARAEGGRLYAANNQQAQEIALLQTRLSTYETALRETRKNYEQALKERDEARGELSSLAQENARLKVLVMPVSPDLIADEATKV